MSNNYWSQRGAKRRETLSSLRAQHAVIVLVTNSLHRRYDYAKEGDQLISYEAGVKKKLPEAIEKMSEKNKPSNNEKLIIKGLTAVQEDIVNPAELRAVWMRAVAITVAKTAAVDEEKEAKDKQIIAEAEERAKKMRAAEVRRAERARLFEHPQGGPGTLRTPRRGH